MPQAAPCRSAQGNEDHGRQPLNDSLKFGSSRFKGLNASVTSVMDSLSAHYFTHFVT